MSNKIAYIEQTSQTNCGEDIIDLRTLDENGEMDFITTGSGDYMGMSLEQRLATFHDATLVSTQTFMDQLRESRS